MVGLAWPACKLACPCSAPDPVVHACWLLPAECHAQQVKVPQLPHSHACFHFGICLLTGTLCEQRCQKGTLEGNHAMWSCCSRKACHNFLLSQTWPASHRCLWAALYGGKRLRKGSLPWQSCCSQGRGPCSYLAGGEAAATPRSRVAGTSELPA